MDNKNSLLKAAGGVYGIYSDQSIEKGFETEVRQGKTMTDVAKECRVKHFVYSSVGGANRDTGIAHFDSKWEIEQYIRSQKLPATILRPVWFMENFLGPQFRESILNGKLSMPLKPGKKLQMIAVDNIGDFVAAAFENPKKYIGQEIEIAGDDLTMPQVAQILSKVIDRDVQYNELPMEDMRKTNEELAKMFQWFNDVDYKSDISKLHQLLPDLMDFETWLHKFGWEHFVKEKAVAAHA
jgi:uncharacterized protein YbjT (DUF2867 family)